MVRLKEARDSEEPDSRGSLSRGRLFEEDGKNHAKQAGHEEAVQQKEPTEEQRGKTKAEQERHDEREQRTSEAHDDVYAHLKFPEAAH